MSDILSDKEFAQKLCNEEKSAMAAFQKSNADKLYFISSTFNRGAITDGYWTYRTIVGQPIKVTDDVSDTYIWLMKQVLLKSCKYRGDNNASFQSYIVTVLNSRYTFINWMRWKSRSGLIEYPKTSGNIPKVVQNLGEDYGKVFVMLRQGKSIGQISSKLNIDEMDCRQIRNEIEVELIKDGKIYLLYRPKELPFDPNPTHDDEGNPIGIQIESDEFIQADVSLEVKDLHDAISMIVKKLSNGQRRILELYWTQEMTIDDIYGIMSEMSPYYDDLSIDQPSDINKVINKVVYNSFSDFKSNFPDITDAYSLQRKFWRNAIKAFFELYNYKN